MLYYGIPTNMRSLKIWRMSSACSVPRLLKMTLKGPRVKAGHEAGQPSSMGAALSLTSSRGRCLRTKKVSLGHDRRVAEADAVPRSFQSRQPRRQNDSGRGRRLGSHLVLTTGKCVPYIREV